MLVWWVSRRTSLTDVVVEGERRMRCRTTGTERRHIAWMQDTTVYAYGHSCRLIVLGSLVHAKPKTRASRPCHSCPIDATTVTAFELRSNVQ